MGLSNLTFLLEQSILIPMTAVREISPKKIKALRLRKDWSVDDVAHALRDQGFKTNGATVSKWERGLVDPRAAILPALASVLDATIDDLYGEPSADDDEESDAMEGFRRIRAELVLAGRDDLADDLLKLLPSEARS